jgi:hypothetical protein
LRKRSYPQARKGSWPAGSGEVKKMERKFESELAGQVARRHKDPIKNRARVLFMTAVSCAVMVAAAAAVMSFGASAFIGEPTVYESEFVGVDYLVSSEDGGIVYTDDDILDDSFLVKRTSELKWIEFDTPGLSTVDYTKVAYSANVKLREISGFPSGVAGMVVADVTINGFTTYAPWIASASLSVNDVDVLTYSAVALDAVPFIAPVYDSVAGTLSVEVTLPDSLACVSGDQISIFVMFKTVEVGLDITGSEIGFPDYWPEIVEPEIVE